MTFKHQSGRHDGGVTRRTTLKGLAAGAAVLAAPSYLRAQSAQTIKIGYISPQTGQMAPFGETDAFALDFIRKLP